jgi:hypothetical protein
VVARNREVARYAAILLGIWAGAARADTSAPGAQSRWQILCVQRLEVARSRLAFGESLGKISVYTDRFGFERFWPDREGGRFGLSAFVGRTTAPASRGWTRGGISHGPDGVVTFLNRRSKSHDAAIVSDGGVPPEMKRWFEDAMLSAIDDCFALEDLPKGEAASPFSGLYALTGTVEKDGCDRRIVLLGTTARIDVAANLLRVNAGEGPHRAWIEGDNLVAAGNFSGKAARDSCEGSRAVEWWELRHTPTGLEGTLDTTWRLKPDCSRTCTVRFRMTARPLGENR